MPPYRELPGQRPSHDSVFEYNTCNPDVRLVDHHLVLPTLRLIPSPQDGDLVYEMVLCCPTFSVVGGSLGSVDPMWVSTLR